MSGYRQKQCIVIIMASILRRRVGARLPSPGLDPKSAILIEQTERLSVGRELLSTTLIIQVIPDQQRTVSCRNQGHLFTYLVTVISTWGLALWELLWESSNRSKSTGLRRLIISYQLTGCGSKPDNGGANTAHCTTEPFFSLSATS